jgi:hypothetical protein
VEVFSDEFLLEPLDELYLHNAATALLPSTDVASLSSIGLVLTTIWVIKDDEAIPDIKCLALNTILQGLRRE